MKKVFAIILILLTFMLLIPLSAMKNVPEILSASAKKPDVPKAKDAISLTFRVLDTSTDKVTEIASDDYLLGVVGAEMPALYEEEALKAQAVAAYTYACYRRSQNTDKTYDITNDHLTDQSYLPPEKLREKWGDNADEYTKKIKSAISDTKGYLITHSGKPILSVYHAISSGKTESAKNVWGSDYAYLKPVNSPGDKLSPNYLSTLSLTAKELSEKLSEEITLSGEPADYFGKCTLSDSGTVLEIPVCGEEIRGARLRSLLNLKSSSFDIAFKDGSFTFTVKGYGHGVGMSQYGANYMAQQGSDFKEILCTYYTGCKVEKTK